MHPAAKKLLKALTLELRHLLEGRYDSDGKWKPGDLEQRLAAIGVRRDRASVPVDELRHLTEEDRQARKVVDAYLKLREEAGVERADAVADFVRETAYTWANRLLALRCMEARELIDSVILQQEAYAGRSLEHHRLAQRRPELCAGDDDGLFAVLDKVFREQAERLPMLFDPRAPGIALRPSPAALKDCFGLLSLNPATLSKYRIRLKEDESAAAGIEPSSSFTAPDALGWAYQYWNTEEKDRVFERVRTVKGAKIAGADIIPATQLYTEDYMVKFLVQNSLGATWLGMHPDSKLAERWEYYVRDADRAPVELKPLSEITFLDPACGSGHFLLEAFDLFYDMYLEEAKVAGTLCRAVAAPAAAQPLESTPRADAPSLEEVRRQAQSDGTAERACYDAVAAPAATQPLESTSRADAPSAICDAILTKNLYGIDIDARAVQIAEVALWMKAAERAFDYAGAATNLVAATANHLKGESWEEFLAGFEREPSVARVLKQFAQTMEHIDEIGSLARPDEDLREIIRQEHATWERQVREEREANYLFGEMRTDALSGQLPFHEISDEQFGHRLFNRAQFALDDFTKSARERGEFDDQMLASEARAGFRLLDLLTRRYDVVAANPPYMGSANMGRAVKAYIERNYKPGKRDLYAAFILRNLNLAGGYGRVAMVTQQSWMFLRSFAEFRAIDDGRLKKLKSGEFRGLLRDRTIETIAHLGSAAFGEITGEVVNCTLFALASAPPSINHHLTAFRLTGPRSPHEKEKLLREVLELRRPLSPVSNRLTQQSLLGIRGATIAYWLSNRLVGLFSSSPQAASYGFMGWGVSSSNNSRFLRYFWEARVSNRWRLHLKGGGFSRWKGFESHLVDWDADGIKLKTFILERYPYLGSNYEIKIRPYTFGKNGWAYSSMTGGALSVRQLLPDQTTNAKSPALFTEQAINEVGAALNSRIACYLLRALTTSVNVDEGYVGALPMPRYNDASVSDLVSACVRAKSNLVERDLIEAGFSGVGRDTRVATCASLLHSAILHSVEGVLEKLTFDAFDLSHDDAQKILDETGTPVGWWPLVDGYHELPDHLLTHALPDMVRTSIARIERKVINHGELSALRAIIRAIYEAGPVTKVQRDDDSAGAAGDDDKDDGDNSEDSPSALVPADTFLEEISQRLQLHPISAFMLANEGIKEGWRCLPEERRAWADRITVAALRLLGHRWPKQIEAGEPVPEWADPDGIIPLTPLADEETLLRRVEQRLAAEEVDAGDFEQVMGKPLGAWLAGEFFKHHTRQFKKRPIAWQLQSGKITARKSPAFACLLYYHKLDADTLPKIRSQYVGPLRRRLETELRGIEGIAAEARSDRQEKRRVELDDAIRELTVFDARLEQVAREGFATTGLAKLLADEPLDRCGSLDGRRPHPTTRAELIAQESAYAPDINDGVRVNIAPLQKGGLLAADVLAKKDLDKAIADRAQWRADERRWVREGKLPQPGWWPEGET